ncbi:hypothetical protein GF378_03085 [Candidatus Pacearchaeota archaeon]|nr:hypothetical protein [Candidatus Pacearchaeota archaeon]
MKLKRGLRDLNYFFKNKKAIATEYLPWILIAVAVLVVLALATMLMREKGIGLIDQLKNIFSGRA